MFTFKKKNPKTVGYIHGNMIVYSILSDTRILSGFALLRECICDDDRVYFMLLTQKKVLSYFIWL